jgi:SAM-dependent methyltransferase
VGEIGDTKFEKDSSMSANDDQAVCYLCRSVSSDILSHEVSAAPASKIYRCKDCTLVYLFPIMTPEEEWAFYQAEFDKYMEGRSGKNWKSPESHYRSFQPEGERRLSLIRPYLKADHRVLEIGSSTGYFLDDLRGYVKEVAGVEPNPAQREYANRRGIPTSATLEELGKGRFDLICFYYVLEHFREPIGYLKGLEKLLKPGGKLIIEVPNVEDVLLGPYAISAFGPFYWQKAHYFNFSRKTLKEVLDRSGYASELLPVQRYDLSNHLVWMMEGKPGGAGRFKDLFTPALEASYADALKTQWRCDTLMAVASRKS